MSVADALGPERLWSPRRLRLPTAVLAGGFVLLAGPTLFALGRQDWSTEQGEQGPIVLALGLWLLWRAWPKALSAGRPGSPVVGSVAGLFAASLYVLGRVSDQILIESYALYFLGLTTCYILVGTSGVRKASFALGYLILALPAPYTLVWALTSHLRLWVTQAVVATYQVAGFSIVRNGLDILVDQYTLAVKEACSGMNSLISLSAIGLLWLHLRRQPPAWYYAALVVPILAFAIFGNYVRILILVALTHFFGDAVAQSYLHETAGAVTFFTALIGVIATDAAFAWALHRKGLLK